MVRCSSRARTGGVDQSIGDRMGRSQTFHKKDQKRKVRSLALNKQRARKRAIPAAPTIVKRKVPRRRPNAEYRSREYLSEKEVGAVVVAAATQGRHGLRDSTLLLIAYRHGLRVAELVSLRWDQIDLAQGLLHVSRLKNGLASVHPLRGPELRALRRLQREEASAAYVFMSERKAPLTPHTVRKIVARAGRQAGLVSYSSAHAASCDRPQARQRRTGHAGDPAIPRTSQYSAHHTLHGFGAESVPEFLVRLTFVYRLNKLISKAL